MSDTGTTHPLHELIAAQVSTHRRSPFLTVGGSSLTYGELDELCNAAANLLLDRGVRAGDIVMARCHNGVAIIATWFACMRIGAVFNPVNALLTGAPMRTVMAAANGALLVCDAELLDAVQAVRSDLPGLRHVLVAGGHASDCESFDDALAAAGTEAPAAPPSDPAAPAKLMFTSGTTGEPKGVVWSRRAETLHGVFYGDDLVRIDEGETAYSCLPLFHATCQGTLLGALLRGGRIAIDRRFDAFAFWQRTRDTGAVFFPYVGTIVSVLGSRPTRPDDLENPIRRAMGSAAPADRWREFESRFGLVLEDVWGQTETASCWTRPIPGQAQPGTVGRPTDRWEARIVLGDGADAADSEPGELLMRPRLAHVMFEGYHGEPTPAYDPDGWYRTGDLMSRERDGDLVFHGRLREAIRRRGEMISPAEIESAASRSPAVLEAAAVGIPADDGVEDEILLCVVAGSAEAVDPQALHRFLRDALPAFMVPRFIRSLDELPKTPTTRVRRHLLRAQGREGAWDAHAGRRQAG
ncbi:MAG: AMP-binding protein [Candidatus Dormibacteraeota bacterium]|uniref:AMP-binding protein n=1 Tax=Candidatus Amunia macphersoniae TaxID=3127014 RepID=A0A934KLZ6_9BACT|nr:AMP-binding protein [Candidatus Dormibacteraeota bacterium]